MATKYLCDTCSAEMAKEEVYDIQVTLRVSPPRTTYRYQTVDGIICKACWNKGEFVGNRQLQRAAVKGLRACMGAVYEEA